MLKIFDIMENLNFEKEVWCDIPNYEGYQVSNFGRIKSLERIDALGRKVEEKILKPQISNNGYYLTGLYKNSIQKFYYVHRLVWSAFNGPIPENMQVNHINEVKTVNRLSNLNLMTHKENMNYGSRTERSAKKQINGKLSKVVLQFTLDNILVKEYQSAHQVERELGFNRGNICSCCNGKLKTAHGFIWRYKE